MKVFLDLEDTVIDNWFNGNPVNIEQVRFFLRLSDVSEVSIFSFAIWNAQHKEEFARRHQKMLEDLLLVKIVATPCVKDMCAVEMNHFGTRFDGHADFVSVRGKQDAFMNWCLAMEKGNHSVLIDDIVTNRVILDFDTKTKIETINVFNVSRGLHKGC